MENWKSQSHLLLAGCVHVCSIGKFARLLDNSYSLLDIVAALLDEIRILLAVFGFLLDKIAILMDKTHSYWKIHSPIGQTPILLDNPSMQSVKLKKSVWSTCFTSVSGVSFGRDYARIDIDQD